MIGVPDAGDASAVELGVKFRADVDGYITGIRYYKSAANTGTHVGNLWASRRHEARDRRRSRTRRSTGWQVVTFSDAGGRDREHHLRRVVPHRQRSLCRDLRVSCCIGLDSPPLHTIPNGTSPNGVYRYGASGFPTRASTRPTTGSTSCSPRRLARTRRRQPSSSTIPVAGAKNVGTTAAVTATLQRGARPGDGQYRHVRAAKRGQRRRHGDGVVRRGDPVGAADARQPRWNRTPVTRRVSMAASSSPRIRDVAGNALDADLVWSFTTRPLPTTLVDTSVADFTRGTLDAGGYIGAAAGGEVMLVPRSAPSSAAPRCRRDHHLRRGSSSPWGGGSSVADIRRRHERRWRVRRDQLDVSAGLVAGVCRDLQRRAVPARRLRGDARAQVDWAMFSSSGGDGLYARTNNGGAQAMNTLIPGSWFGAAHRFRIDWSASQVAISPSTAFRLRRMPSRISASMRPMASDYNGDGNALAIDWMRMTPYAAASTYLSGIFDASATATWIAATMSGETPAGTAVLLSVRYGDSPVPDGSWTAFTPGHRPARGHQPLPPVPPAVDDERQRTDAGRPRRDDRPQALNVGSRAYSAFHVGRRQPLPSEVVAPRPSLGATLRLSKGRRMSRPLRVFTGCPR